MKQWRPHTFSLPITRPGPGPPNPSNVACPLPGNGAGHCNARSAITHLALANERLRRELEALRRGARLARAPAAPPLRVDPFRRLEQSVQRLEPDDLVSEPAKAMQQVENSLAEIWREMEPGAGEEELRDLVVQTMRLSLDLWQESTRSSKAELARRSRQWSVYINDNGWERTQGLDRYLDPVTLPKHPRIRKVLRTGDFVLGSCSETVPSYRKLQKTLKRLRELQTRDG